MLVDHCKLAKSVGCGSGSQRRGYLCCKSIFRHLVSGRCERRCASLGRGCVALRVFCLLWFVTTYCGGSLVFLLTLFLNVFRACKLPVGDWPGAPKRRGIGLKQWFPVCGQRKRWHIVSGGPLWRCGGLFVGNRSRFSCGCGLGSGQRCIVRRQPSSKRCAWRRSLSNSTQRRFCELQLGDRIEPSKWLGAGLEQRRDIRSRWLCTLPDTCVWRYCQLSMGFDCWRFKLGGNRPEHWCLVRD